MNKKPGKIKVAVAVSGGVDSSVALALLKKQGFEVFGVFMHFWSENISGKVRDNICCSLEAQEDARKVCRKLGVPFYTMNMTLPFKKKVVDDFLDQYENCRTPNPCVLCNKHIKFGEFIKRATEMGADFVATGHYARNPKSEILNSKQIQNPKSQNTNIINKLLISKDIAKDQTYFLHQLNKKQLSKIIFPIGKYTKAEVRALAKKFNLPTASKKESQEVCFVPGGNLQKFFEKYLKLKSGDIVDIETKKVLGKHNGLARYTIGQRKGIGLHGGPWYVVGLDKEENILRVSRNESDFLSNELQVKNVNWISGVCPEFPLKAKCKVRYCSEDANSIIETTNEKNIFRVKFKKPVRAATPGQYCVFWKGKECLGGGVIQQS
ncbi:tRNA 2-thiouridine(34) synthase MnmA [Patescibacteria group bacterium]|nr:tRNA 2-thiouridine(34) synthase MnmA [Patescibacteria group bacterium]